MQNEIIVGIIVGVVSGIICGLLGWSLSNFFIGRRVIERMEEMDGRITDYKLDVSRVKDNFADHRRETTSHIIAMTELVKSVLNTADNMMKATHSLVEVVTVQNAVLNTKIK
jgi:hypothetical protein